MTIDNLSESSSDQGSVSEESINAASPKSTQNKNNVEANNMQLSPEVKGMKSRLMTESAFHGPNVI